MKFSICIPAMGREKMLAQSLHSILAQEHEDYEVVVRDDDPDHPIDWSKFHFVDERFHYFLEPHLGTFSGVANAVLKHATGDILYVMGSDDLLCPSALYTVNEVFEQDRFGGAMWGYGKTISTDEHMRYQNEDGAPMTLEDLQAKNAIGMPATFWNRRMWEASGTFDTRYRWACDYDMWLRFWRIRKPEFINHTLGFFRHHSSHMSTDRKDEIEAEAQKISLRHQLLGDVMSRARNRQIQNRLYEGAEAPTSHDLG